MRGRGSGGGALVIVLVLQLVIAAVFIGLVVTDSLPIPGAAIAADWPPLGHAAAALVD